jgi:hypothetical protein
MNHNLGNIRMAFRDLVEMQRQDPLPLWNQVLENCVL